MAAKDDKPKTGKDTLKDEAPADALEPGVVVLEESDVPQSTPSDVDGTDLTSSEVKQPAETDDLGEDAHNDSGNQTEPPQKRSGGIWVPAFIGAIAAFAVAVAFVIYETRPGGMLARDTQAIDELRASVLALEGQVEEASAANSALSAKFNAQASDYDVLVNRMNTIDQTLAKTAQLSANMSGIETRLTDLENRPIPDIGATQDAVAAYETQLAAMRSMLESELQKIKEQAEQSASLQVSAADLQRQAAVENLATRLSTAIDDGKPFGDMLSGLSELGVDLPAELKIASAGTISSAKLAADFSPVARELVEADVRAKVASGEIGRFEAFLRLQLGARSTAPTEGTNVEAIVARVEASLSQGDLAEALQELEPLRAQAIPTLVEWLNEAGAHYAAAEAAQQIATANE